MELIYDKCDHFFNWTCLRTIWVNVRLNLYERLFFIQKLINYTSYFYFAIGLLLIILAFIGTISIIRKNLLLEGVLVTILIFISVILIGVALFLSVINLNGSLSKTIKNEIEKSFESFDETNTELIHTKLIDQIQLKYKCCGKESYRDWEKLLQKNLNDKKSNYNNKFLLYKNQLSFDLPDSCCIKYELNCGKDFPLNNTINNEGCLNSLVKFSIKLCYQNFAICIFASSIIIFCIIYILFVSFGLKNDYYILNS